MDDDTGQGSVGDVKEDGSQSIEGEQDDNGGNDTSKGSADASLGLDGGSRERTGSGISTEEGTEQVGDTNGDKLLRGVDDIVVDTAEGFGDGDVLDKDNDDGGGDLGGEGLDDARVDLGSGGMGETCGHVR